MAQVETSAAPVSRARAVASYPWLMNSRSAVSKVAAGPLRIRWQGAGGGAVREAGARGRGLPCGGSREGPGQLVVQVGLCLDEDVVSRLQPGIGLDGHELAVAHDEADPCFAGQAGELVDGAAVGGRAGGDGELVDAGGLVPQPDSQRPGLG